MGITAAQFSIEPSTPKTTLVELSRSVNEDMADVMVQLETEIGVEGEARVEGEGTSEEGEEDGNIVAEADSSAAPQELESFSSSVKLWRDAGIVVHADPEFGQQDLGRWVGGWGLKKGQRSGGSLSEEAKEVLTRLFWAGEETGTKSNAAHALKEVAEQLGLEADEDADNVPTLTQILGFFSKLAKGKLRLD